MITEGDFKRMEEMSLHIRKMRVSANDMANDHRREVLALLDRRDLSRDEHYRLLALIRQMDPEYE